MPGRVFVDTHYTYRSWRYAIVFVPFATAAGWMLYQVVKAARYGPSPQAADWWKVLAVLGFTGSFTTVAWILGWGMLTNRKIVARIDSRGVTMGKRHLPWERIRYIATAASGSSGYMLKLGVRRSVDWHFWIGRPWTQEEYAALRAELDPFLEEAHPEVGLGA